MTTVGIATFAAVGAVLRYLTDRTVARRTGGAFPWGTLLVNVAGCFLLGAISGSSRLTRSLLGAGFSGSLTTFSTFGYETVRLVEHRAFGRAIWNVALNAGFGLAAAAAGLALAG